MPLRAKIILAVIIGIVSLAVLAVVIWGVARVMNNGQEATPAPEQTTQETEMPSLGGQETAVEVIPTTTPVPTLPTATQSEQSLAAIVMPFVDTLGTYSSQSNYQNLRDIMPFMTPSMRTWAQGLIDKAQGQPFNPLYTGTTTKSLGYTFTPALNANATEAMVRVATQRRESVGTAANFKVYNQDVVVQMVKVGDQWLVSDAQWQEVE